MKKALNHWVTRGLILALLFLPLVFKAWYVDQYIARYTGQHLIGAREVLFHDALFYGAMAGFFYLSAINLAPPMVRLLFRAVSLVLLTLYISDLVVFLEFNMRLSVEDAMKYAWYTKKYLLQAFSDDLFFLLWTIASLGIVIVMFLFTRIPLDNRRANYSASILLVLLFVSSAFADAKPYVHAWTYQNLLEYNRMILSESTPYSKDTVAQFSRTTSSCKKGPQRNPNVIVLLIESLSSYHSKLFSGIHDWTPNLDRIARENLYFSNFFANGFITEDGKIAFMTGELPLYPPSSFSEGGGTAFKGYYKLENPLATRFRKHGYLSEFLTTADLDFSNTGYWVKHSANFDYAEGHTHPSYNEWPRFQFNAAPDKALYQRVLQRVEAHQKNHKRYFLNVLTVSTHHPFTDPETGDRSEQMAFSYADRELGIFYDELKSRNFFENGILIISGDHRAMTPVQQSEIERFGPYGAAARVPLVIVGDSAEPVVVTENFQQTDVAGSLENLINGEICVSDWNGHLLGSERTPPKFILHRRGDARNLVSVFSADTDYLVYLDGDNTRVVRPETISAATQKEILDEINAIRIYRSNPAFRKPRNPG